MPFTPVDITPAQTGQWVTVDLSSYLSDTQQLVSIRAINSNNGSYYAIGLQNADSTLNKTGDLYGERAAVFQCPVNSSKQIKLYRESTNISFYLIEAFNSEGVGLTNLVDFTPGTINTYETVDVSSYVSEDAGFAVFHVYSSTSSIKVFYRHPDSTDNRYNYTTVSFGFIVPLNSSKECEIATQDITSTGIYLAGYIETSHQKVNGYDCSLSSSGSWQDIDLSSDSDALANSIALVDIQCGSNYYGGIRENGDSAEPYYKLGTVAGSFFVRIDSSKIFEGKISHTNVNFFVLGYVVPITSGGSGPFENALTLKNSIEVGADLGFKNTILIAHDLTLKLDLYAVMADLLLKQSIETGSDISFRNSLGLEDILSLRNTIQIAGDLTSKNSLTIEDVLTVLNSIGIGDGLTVKNSIKIADDFSLKNSIPIELVISVLNSLGLEEGINVPLSLREITEGALTIRNKLAGALERALTLINTLQERDTVHGDVSIRNHLFDTTTARYVSTSFTVSINGQGITLDITDDVLSVSIEMGTINSVTVTCSPDLHDVFKSIQGSGSDALIVTIAGEEYRFMVEDIDTSESIESDTLQIWGRSSSAQHNDIKYTSEVTKIWDTPVSATDVITELVGSGYTYELDDFIIPGQKLQAEKELPLSIVERIIEVSGGIVLSDKDGSLIFKKQYPVNPDELAGASPDFEITDFDDVIELSDDFIVAEGYNSVTVRNGTEADNNETPEIQVDVKGDKSTFAPGETVHIRVMTCPLDLALGTDVTMGSAVYEGAEIFEHTEEITISDGKASTTYPVSLLTSVTFTGRDLGFPQFSQGKRELIFTGEDCSGNAIAEVTYTVKSRNYRVTANNEGKLIFCAGEI